jgi:hypothetical protein
MVQNGAFRQSMQLEWQRRKFCAREGLDFDDWSDSGNQSYLHF